MSTTTRHTRPLSPFLMYRWQYTNTLSILNRITGVVLTAALPLLIYWLVAAASGEAAYARTQSFFSHPFIQLVLYAVSFSFFFHLTNGVRHLVWDTVHGLERRSARISGWVVFIGSVILTILLWALVWSARGGAA